ncbi:DUF2958 domain-containing protein [Geodermatophilus sp. SYSU D00758]
MKLLTETLKKQIPQLYSQEQEADPVVVAKFFAPGTGWTWYVIEGATREKEGCGFGVGCDHRPLTEYDPERDDVVFFGYVIGVEPELGYFTLSELLQVRGISGLPVERDRYFMPCRLSRLRK